MSQPSLVNLVQVSPTQFDHPACVFLHDLWQQKRSARAMPSRADFSPVQLKQHLGWVTILDVLPSKRDFRYRLIGTLVTEYFATDWTGKTVMEAFASHGEAVAKQVNSTFRKVARDRVVMRTSGNADWLAEGMEEYEAVYLPLSDDGENVTHILHAFVCDRDRMLMARQIARNNGGKLITPPKVA